MARILGSKTGYLDTYPKSFTVFNANIITKYGKAWYGDLDLTRDGQKLKEIAEEWGSIVKTDSEAKKDKILGNWFNYIANKFFQLHDKLNKPVKQ